MNGIVVYRTADDGLSRQVWQFHTISGYVDWFGIVLKTYGIERRKQPKGRYSKATVPDRWSSYDERSYTSGLKRPTSIPAEVAEEAWAKAARKTFIYSTSFEVTP